MLSTTKHDIDIMNPGQSRINAVEDRSLDLTLKYILDCFYESQSRDVHPYRQVAQAIYQSDTGFVEMTLYVYQGKQENLQTMQKRNPKHLIGASWHNRNPMDLVLVDNKLYPELQSHR